jgi:hypothetical protein
VIFLKGHILCQKCGLLAKLLAPAGGQGALFQRPVKKAVAGSPCAPWRAPKREFRSDAGLQRSGGSSLDDSQASATHKHPGSKPRSLAIRERNARDTTDKFRCPTRPHPQPRNFRAPPADGCFGFHKGAAEVARARGSVIAELQGHRADSGADVKPGVAH